MAFKPFDQSKTPGCAPGSFCNEQARVEPDHAVISLQCDFIRCCTLPLQRAKGVRASLGWRPG
jgi:hypothetical protein